MGHPGTHDCTQTGDVGSRRIHEDDITPWEFILGSGVDRAILIDNQRK